MELIKGKRTGKVLFIVEGGKHEFNLMKKIFVDILDFTQIEKHRGNARYYRRNADKHSMVAVINTKTSNIASIHDEEYLDAIYEELIERYDFDVNHAAIYYLFDRDPRSNVNTKLMQGLIHILKNAFDNDGSERGGMLILSYPSVESYEISNFIDESSKLCMGLGKEVKEYINSNAKKISINKITEDSIVHAGLEWEKCMDEMGVQVNLDDFSDANAKIFHYEENYYMENHTFKLLSMLSCALMDLGILKA